MKKYIIISLSIVTSFSYGQLVSFNPSGTDTEVIATDMDTLTTGSVGSTWVMSNDPSSGVGALYTPYADSPTDSVMIWDYTPDSGPILDLTLASDQSFNTAPLHISWNMGRTRGLTGSRIVIVGYGADDSTEVFRFDWNQKTQELSTGPDGNDVVMGDFNHYVNPANPLSYDMATMGITLNGTSLTYSAGDLTDITTTVMNSQTELSRISFVAEVGLGAGFALDNLNIATGLPAQIVSFSATPSVFEVGDTVTLNWEVLDADSVSINNGIGTIAAVGSLQIMPTDTTTWQLSAVRGDVTTIATAAASTLEDELFEGEEYTDAFNNPDDDPDLPNVLLIGDSISIGYTVQVRISLAGKADVFRISSNGKDSGNGVNNIDGWIGTQTWDVIHFNWGLWDLAYRNPDSNNQGGRDKVDGTLTYTPEEYRANMELIVARLKETDATLMWCATTPVPEGELGRFEGDDIIYNNVAAEIMTANGIVTNDLHSYALLALPEIQKAYGDVHFTDAGYVYLGEQVALEIEGLLTADDVISFEEWRMLHFGTTEDTGTAANTYDADSDGESNLLEFATGQDPNASTLASTPLDIVGDNLEFRYTCSKNALAAGIIFNVEWSDSLESETWSSVDVTETTDSQNTTDSETETRIANIPDGSTGQRFVHLKVSLP